MIVPARVDSHCSTPACFGFLLLSSFLLPSVVHAQENDVYCSRTQACPSGFVCHTGICQQLGECDAPCTDKQVCIVSFGISTCYSDSMQPCAPDNRDGYCEENLFTCSIGGVCAFNGHRPCNSQFSTPLQGDCGWGKICQLGQCIDRNGACSFTNFHGKCPSGATCINGYCVSESGGVGACSFVNSNGECPITGDVCTAGICTGQTDPVGVCSPSNPAGRCPSDQSCTNGACVAAASDGAASGDSVGGTGGNGAGSGSEDGIVPLPNAAARRSASVAVLATALGLGAAAYAVAAV